MASQPPAGQRFAASAGVIVGMVGLAITIIGLLIAIGKWQGDIDGKFATADNHLATLDKRMDQAEANQRTYIPVLVKMTADVSYLADRAHREDDARERERR